MFGPQPQIGSRARSRSGAELLHAVEEVGVAGEVDRAGRPASEEADRLARRARSGAAAVVVRPRRR